MSVLIEDDLLEVEESDDLLEVRWVKWPYGCQPRIRTVITKSQVREVIDYIIENNKNRRAGEIFWSIFRWLSDAKLIIQYHSQLPY